MSKSQRLRLHDIRKVHDLIHKVQCVGDQPELWQRLAINGLLEILGGNVGITVDVRLRPDGVPHLLDPIDTGRQTGCVRRRFQQYVISGEMAADPGAPSLLAAQKKHRYLTRTRRELVDDSTWYGSSCGSEARRMGDADDFVVCSSELVPNGCQGFIVYRCWRDRPFETRHRRIMQLFRLELMRAVRDGERALSDDFPKLAPRLRETLDLILTGLPLKAIADRLGVSRHTINDYQKTLYHHFGVQSRPELMYLFRTIKRPIHFPTCPPNTAR